MDAIRIQNLRSFDDTGFIDIKPVSLLIGKNSSGKSTFLRCFPLFKQSVEARTTGPILWNGRFVDFGNFSTAINDYNNNNEIILHFRFNISLRSVDSRLRLGRIFIEDNNLPIELSLKMVSDDQDQSQISEISTKIYNEHEVKIKFNANGRIVSFVVNKNDFSSLSNNMYGDFQKFGMMPFIFERNSKDDESELNEISPLRRGAFREKLYQEFKNRVRGNTDHDTIIKMINFTRIGKSDYMLERLKNEMAAPTTWKKNISNWVDNDTEFCLIRDLIIGKSIPDILMTIDSYINNLSTNIRYIAPVRATAERYYRIQNLAIDEVDFQGQNLAMFLRNLTNLEFKKFQEWTKQNFEFIPEVISSSGHISINIRENNSEKSLNIADKGFGYSQILPILAQIWIIVYQKVNLSKREGRMPIIFAVEQPELHLHPYLQSQMLDAFIISIKSARDSGIDLRLIIETHSEYIINRLGHRIANNDFNKDDANIVLFEKDYPNKPTLIRHSQYDDSGFLVNWPLGFFEPEDI